MNCSIEVVDLFWVQFSYDFCKFFSNYILQDICGHFRGFFDIVIKLFENAKNKIESFLIYICDFNLSKKMGTPPCSMTFAY